MSVIVALGALFTVRLKVTGVPTQAPCEGVAVMVEIVCVVTWLAVKVGIVPVPEAPMPVAVLLFVQATVAVALLVVQAIAGTVAPSQKTLEAGTVMVGAGLTVIVKLLAVPLHVPRCGTTEIVAVTGFAELFVAVKEGSPPFPDAANPILGWLFVHVNVAVAGVPVNVVAGTVPPEQSEMGVIAVTVGDGFTTTGIICWA